MSPLWSKALLSYSVVVLQSLSHIQLFATRWTAACQASLPFTISCILLKLMSTELVLLSNQLILCCPLLLLPLIFPSIRFFFFFPVSQLFVSGGQNIGASASALLMNIQGWFPLRLFRMTAKSFQGSTLPHLPDVSFCHSPLLPVPPQLPGLLFLVHFSCVLTGSSAWSALLSTITWLIPSPESAT